MSYEITLIGEKHPMVNESKNAGYKILDNGVLQVLEKNDAGKWFIKYEFSPAAWRHAEGTIYYSETKDIVGRAGWANPDF